MDLQELIKSVQKIDIFDNGIYNHNLSGAYHSTLKGQGLTFDAIRKYEPGDDVRAINWNATARFRQPYVNTFIEDKERVAWILVDVSSSNLIAGGNKSKIDVAIEAAATLAYSLVKMNDKVGLIFFNDKIERVIRPAKGISSFWNMARAMVNVKQSAGETNLSNALVFLGSISNKRSLVFLVSDFIADNYATALQVLQQKNQVIAIRVFDEKDYRLPNMGWVKLKDAEESTTQWVNTSSARFKAGYSKQSAEAVAYFNRAMQPGPANSLAISTTDDVVNKLWAFMRFR